jgi:hypothetical protein
MSVSYTPACDDAFWRAIGVLTRAYGHFTVPVVSDLTGLPRPRVLRHVDYLMDEQILRIVSPSPQAGRRAYAMIAHGEVPPLQPARASQMRRQRALWTALRTLKRATAVELAITASTEILPITAGIASGYLHGLVAGGYVTADVTGHFRLVAARNTGPRAPMVLDHGCFDLNELAYVPRRTLGRAA